MLTLKHLHGLDGTVQNKRTLWRRYKVLNSTVYFSNVDCEAIRARITLKLGSLLSFMIRNVIKSACVGKKS